MATQKVSDACVNLVEEFEGFSSKPYQDPVGIWTIGYGETKGVTKNTAPITQAQAAKMLRTRLDRDYAPAIRGLKVALAQNQFDALVSFVYNVGPGGVGTDTGIGRALRAKHWAQAADELLKWDKAGGRALPGLTRRRTAERALFLAASPALEGYTPAEVRWIREYDRLVGAGKDAGRRRVLRRVMTEQRKRIWHAAQNTGWDKASRKARYRSLLSRTS